MGALRFDTPTYTMGMCVITITWWPCACKLISPLHNCTCDKSDGCSVINAFLLWDEAHWIHDNEHHDCQNLSVRTCWIDSERWCTNIIQSSLWLNYSLIGPIVSTTRVSEVYHIIYISLDPVTTCVFPHKWLARPIRFCWLSTTCWISASRLHINTQLLHSLRLFSMISVSDCPCINRNRTTETD